MKQAPTIQLGTIAVSKEARESLHESDIQNALNRHERGDWGDISEAEKREAKRAVQTGDTPISSVYYSEEGQPFWVMTEPASRITAVDLLCNHQKQALTA